MKELIAIKFTYALEPLGGYWLAYSDRTTDYVYSLPISVCPAIRCLVHANVGMWMMTRKLSITEKMAWDHWALV